MELNLIELAVDDFALDPTLDCGQAFRWRRIDQWWYGVVGGQILKIRQEDQTLFVEFSKNLEIDFIRDYFDLDRNLSQTLKFRDGFTDLAFRKFWGMRILNQDLWECLASFILSQNNNVPRIKKMIANISKNFGVPIKFGDFSDHTFPTAKSIANSSIEDLSDCRLGYRADYLFETARSVADGSFRLEDLKNLSYENAPKKLITLKGVGEKVADCVCLFSLGHGEAFPIDVWVKRTIENLYLKRTATPREIREFCRDYFGENLGYVQQYLFHYARSIGFEN